MFEDVSFDCVGSALFRWTLCDCCVQSRARGQQHGGVTTGIPGQGKSWEGNTNSSDEFNSLPVDTPTIAVLTSLGGVSRSTSKVSKVQLGLDSSTQVYSGMAVRPRGLGTPRRDMLAGEIYRSSLDAPFPGGGSILRNLVGTLQGNAVQGCDVNCLPFSSSSGRLDTRTVPEDDADKRRLVLGALPLHKAALPDTGGDKAFMRLQGGFLRRAVIAGEGRGCQVAEAEPWKCERGKCSFDPFGRSLRLAVSFVFSCGLAATS